jgi:MOSC domain-containing protein YiiM
MSSDYHLSTDAIEARLAELPPVSKDDGAIVLVVARPDVGERETPSRCALTPEHGVANDRWAKKENPVLAAQVAVMRADVARVIANGQPLSLFGDNLLVELDLAPENLPLGTRLRVGTALCEVTEKPHNGCVKFASRFGQDARDVLAKDAWRTWRLRGLYVKVIEAGEVSPGDRMRVVSR